MKYVVNYKLSKEAKKNLEKKATKALAKSVKAKKLPDDMDSVEYAGKPDALTFLDDVKKTGAKGVYHLHECHHDDGDGQCLILEAGGQ